jgi:AbrB family looped-hinge helix DNA binding protein
MTVVRLSAKGQLVIPKAIRKTLGLHPGAQLQLQLVERKIILEPIEFLGPVDALYGKYTDADFLVDLEMEHQRASPVTGDPELIQLQNDIQIEKLSRNK